MSESAANTNHASEPAPRRSWAKRVLFLLILFAALVALAEVGLRISRTANKGRVGNLAEIDQCQSVVFLTLGDSFTYGLFTEPHEAYPRRFQHYFNETNAPVRAEILNLGLPGTNTSEGLEILKRFFSRPNVPQADFALIMYGGNNRWNLHHASFWDWADEHKQGNYFEYLTSKLKLSKFFTIASDAGAREMDRIRNTHPDVFLEMARERKWNTFFKDFSDSLLVKWLERDLVRMAGFLENREVLPIFVSYPSQRPKYLNGHLMRIADKTGSKSIDMAKTVAYFAKRDLYAEDDAHLNARGNDLVGRWVFQGFKKLFSQSDLQQLIDFKKSSKRCRGSWEEAVALTDLKGSKTARPKIGGAEEARAR